MLMAFGRFIGYSVLTKLTIDAFLPIIISFSLPTAIVNGLIFALPTFAQYIFLKHTLFTLMSFHRPVSFSIHSDESDNLSVKSWKQVYPFNTFAKIGEIGYAYPASSIYWINPSDCATAQDATLSERWL